MQLIIQKKNQNIPNTNLLCYYLAFIVLGIDLSLLK